METEQEMVEVACRVAKEAFPQLQFVMGSNVFSLVFAMRKQWLKDIQDAVRIVTGADL